MLDQPDEVAGLEHRPAGLSPEVSRAGDAGRGSPMAWLLVIVALGFVVNVLSDRHLYSDSFYDLYAGRYIVRHGIPHWNVVTVAAHGAPWTDQQWLAQVIYYGAWAVGGYPAVAAASALLVTSGFAVLARLMLDRGVPPTRMVAWAAAAMIACLGNMVIRAQSFAYPLLALTLGLILADSGAARLRGRTWLVVPVLVIWANTHGSVLVGAALAGLYAGYRAAAALVRHDGQAVPGYLALGAAAAGSVLCTPYGTGVLRYYARIEDVTPALARDIPEWSPPNPLSPLSWGFFALVVAAAIAVAVAWRRGARPDPVLAVAALVLLGLALIAIRNQAWFGVGGSLLAADTLARSGRGRVPALSQAFGRVTAGVLAAAALIGLGVLAAAPASQFEGVVPRRAIGTAAALAAQDPAARVLGDDESGSAMLWLHPALLGRVGFDARLEQYSPAQIGAYADFLGVHGPAWQRVMRGYDIVVVSRQRRLLATALAGLPGWRVMYSGRDGLVIQRSPRMLYGYHVFSGTYDRKDISYETPNT